ncbi:MAG: AI-2E family transporter [Reichenbachiella sp.]
MKTFLWALIAFLLYYIPNIGSFIAVIPAVLFSIVQLEFSGVVWTTIAFVLVNVVVGSVIEPKVMGKKQGLSTFVVFLSLLFWGFLLGTVGMFLSIPITMSIKIILEQNPKTLWMAILLGSQMETETLLNKKVVQEL